MGTKEYLTTPPLSEKMPRGGPYILTNEAFERFSFYGMRCILVLFMTQYLMGAGGALAVMPETAAKKYFHLFVAAVYFTPLIGALLCDVILGKFKTIIIFASVNCVGLLFLVFDQTRFGLATALFLVAIGSGAMKPCVSANVGDQFGKSNLDKMQKFYAWFYFSINFGSTFSTLLVPVLLDKYGPRIAFAVPSVAMVLATVAFWLGKWKYVHVPPGGIKFVKEVFSGEGLRALAKLCIIYAFVAMFWALWDQNDSAWILQAEHMNRQWLGHEWLSAQVVTVNPLFIMLLIPVFSYVIYPAIDKIFPLTALRKISIGFFVTVFAFSMAAVIQVWIDRGATPSIGWQILAHFILAAAEVMVSITCLLFSYTQAPKKMKSFVMSVFFLSITLGDLFTAGVNWFIENEDGSVKLEGAAYFWFFAGIMLATAIAFIPVAAWYKEKTYIQDNAREE
ncbi:MAG: POT family MFS transporter [Planctomycetota bacterium]|jgi:POT family proton-dependent oligopeptide transporter